jgi:hypothetical protein
VARPPFPTNLREFQRQFATEKACQQYLAVSRWPDGFRCPLWVPARLRDAETRALAMCRLPVPGIRPGTVYALDQHNKHVLRATTRLRMVCVFNRP